MTVPGRRVSEDSEEISQLGSRVVARFEAGGTVPTLAVLEYVARALGADSLISVNPHVDVA